MKKEPIFKKGTYKLHSYRFWYKKAGYKGREKECQVDMIVEHDNRITTITNALWCLLSVFEEEAPKEYAYIESIQQHFDLLNDDDEGLVRVLEDEGFDFHSLISLYLENLEAGELKDVPEPVDEDIQAEFKPGLTEHVNLGDGLCDEYKKAAEKILYKRLAKLHELNKDEQEAFDNLIFEYAYPLGKNSANMIWLAEGYDKPNEVQQEALRAFEPEGRRKEIEKYLHRNGINNPPFTTEIVCWEDWWNVTGSNKAYVYLRFITDEGEGYDGIYFSDLRKEAYLRFPDIYRRILELEAEQPNYLKMEQPVLAGLLAEAWDLNAVAHSHAIHYIDVKGPIIWERMAKETESERWGEYGEYLKRKQFPKPPSNRVKWLQIVERLHSEVADAWMAILLRECEVLFEEGVDYRIRDCAIHAVMVNASNLFYDFRDDMEFLYEGARRSVSR